MLCSVATSVVLVSWANPSGLLASLCSSQMSAARCHVQAEEALMGGLLVCCRSSALGLPGTCSRALFDRLAEPSHATNAPSTTQLLIKQFFPVMREVGAEPGTRDYK